MRGLLHCWVSVYDLLEVFSFFRARPSVALRCSSIVDISLITNRPYLGYPCPNSDCMCELM